MNFAPRLWESLRTSLWFIPSLLVLGSALLALGLIEVDLRVGGTYQDHWPRLFGAGAGGSRDMLATIAGSMITVAGIAFSITIVALSLASAQYTSRILRNFMRDRPSQAVLGAFLGIFVYCLLVLRALRDNDGISFIPSLAVLFAVVLAVAGIGCLIFFIHHIASSIQAESIVKMAADDTLDTIDALFPDEIGEGDCTAEVLCEDALAHSTGGLAVMAPRSGYVELVDIEGLLRLASTQDFVVRMERGVGEFVVEGTPLVSVHRSGGLVEPLAVELAGQFAISHQRTMVQDVGFGIRQIVDVALKALSPGVNDTTTAVTCVHYLTAILRRLSTRRMEAASRQHDGKLRVIVRCATFPQMVGEAFDQIRQNSGGNVAVLLTMVESLELLLARTREPSRRAALRRQVRRVADVSGRTIRATYDAEDINAALERLGEMPTPAP